MMVRTLGGMFGLAVVSALIAGCPNSVVSPGETDSAALSAVTSKAVEVAASVGTASGFGGVVMTGYAEHMPFQLGFGSEADLASAASAMTVRLTNQSDADGTFHLSYFASHMGFDDFSQDINVSAGDDVTIELPCAEILGLGPLAGPGEAGCHLANGEAIANTMAVPGFLGQDFACGGVYEYLLTPDIDDLDGDGDSEELILLSEAMDFHLSNGGPMGHMHGDGFDVMSGHMFGTPADGDPETLRNLVERIENVALLTGEAGGYGGLQMEGYYDHMPSHMGFTGSDDLAPVFGNMFVQLRNEADQDSTFDVSYMAGHLGLEAADLEVAVGMGEQMIVEVPCSEVVGIGLLDEPGGIGCVLADGETVDNLMAVPGFLGQDFVCGGMYTFVLRPDVDDLDGDGDTEELIIVSDAMESHILSGGPTGHMHDTVSGMMGSRMGF